MHLGVPGCFCEQIYNIHSQFSMSIIGLSILLVFFILKKAVLSVVRLSVPLVLFINSKEVCVSCPLL